MKAATDSYPLWLVSVLTCLMFLSGCYLATGTESESGCMPVEYSWVMPEDIYGKIDSQRKKVMFASLSDVLSEIGPASVKQTETDPALMGNDDPNVIKAYISYRRSSGKPITELEKQEQARSVDVLEQYSRLYSHNVTLQKALAKHNLENGKFYAGLRYARAAVSLDPNDIEAAVLCSDIYMEQQRWDQALLYAELAGRSEQAVVSNEFTALARANMAISLEKLGYLQAAADCYKQAWQLMQYHRRFGHLNNETQEKIGRCDFQLLLASRCYLQCGLVQDAVESLARVERGPNILTLSGYLTDMMIELPESRQARFNMIKYFYRYMLAIGKHKEHSLRAFAAASKKMELIAQYKRTLQLWYSIRPESCPALLDKTDYARGLKYGGEHTLARLILKNAPQMEKTAEVWLEFARAARQSKDYQSMLDAYISCLDSSYSDSDAIVKEFDNILKLDISARDWLTGYRVPGSVLLRD
ncbi:MAG: hypothetical protein JW745_03020, partial [Sedimentisphaerales bacterium]|nr:hypothetical protein [Sedimentisphaerales bacterium]